MAIDFQSWAHATIVATKFHTVLGYTKLSQITLPLNMVSKLNFYCGGGGHFSCVCVAHTVRLTSLSQCRVVALSQNPRCCRQVQHLVAKPKFCRKVQNFVASPKLCRSVVLSQSPKCCRMPTSVQPLCNVDELKGICMISQSAFLKPKNGQKTSRCKPRWLQGPQSWPQIAHPHSTQFVCVIARSFCLPQTSKLS